MLLCKDEKPRLKNEKMSLIEVLQKRGKLVGMKRPKMENEVANNPDQLSQIEFN